MAVARVGRNAREQRCGAQQYLKIALRLETVAFPLRIVKMGL